MVLLTNSSPTNAGSASPELQNYSLVSPSPLCQLGARSRHAPLWLSQPTLHCGYLFPGAQSFAQSSHSKAWENSAPDKFFLSGNHTCKIPDNFSLESTENKNTGCEIYLLTLINYSMLEIFWQRWQTLPPDRTVLIYMLPPFIPASISRRTIPSSCIPHIHGLTELEELTDSRQGGSFPET